MIEFCPNCGKILIPKRENEIAFIECVNCNFKERVFAESMNETIFTKEVGDGIHDGINLAASFEHKCQKCGYDKAEVIDMGVFISDEDNLVLIRCGKCGFTERKGRKTS